MNNYCPKCNKTIEDNSYYCRDCGTRIIDEPKNVCYSCNAIINDNSYYCRECGSLLTNLEDNSSLNLNTSSKITEKKVTPGLILIILIFVLVLAVPIILADTHIIDEYAPSDVDKNYGVSELIFTRDVGDNGRYVYLVTARLSPPPSSNSNSEVVFTFIDSSGNYITRQTRGIGICDEEGYLEYSFDSPQSIEKVHIDVINSQGNVIGDGAINVNIV